MIRAFLDANILFSAAWSEASGINRLWDQPDIQLVTSIYALAEAQQNILLKRPNSLVHLNRLMLNVQISALTTILRRDYGLPENDIPIINTAIAADCSVLLTGDMRHFGHLINDASIGISVMTVSMFFASLINEQQEE